MGAYRYFLKEGEGIKFKTKRGSTKIMLDEKFILRLHIKKT